MVVRPGQNGMRPCWQEERLLYRDNQRWVGPRPAGIVRVWPIAWSVLNRQGGQCEYGAIELQAGEPTVFYRRQQVENGAVAFEQKPRRTRQPRAARLLGEEDPDYGPGSGRACGPQKKRLGLLHWLNPQQRSVLFFREHVKQTVRTLAYIADALP